MDKNSNIGFFILYKLTVTSIKLFIFTKELINKLMFITAENSTVLKIFIESTYYNEQNKQQPM